MPNFETNSTMVWTNFLALELLFVYLGRRESVIKVCGLRRWFVLVRSFGSLFFFFSDFGMKHCASSHRLCHIWAVFHRYPAIFFNIVFFCLITYYSSHLYICITLLLSVSVQIRPKFMVANKIKFMSYISLT